MRFSGIKSAALAAATALAATGLAIGTAGAAQAATNVDITSVSGGGVLSATTGSAYVKIKFTTAPKVGSWYVEGADVYRGSRKLATVDAFRYNSSVLYVPIKNAWGRGKFSLRHIKINWFSKDSSSEGTFFDNNVAGTFTIKGGTAGHLKHNTYALVVKAHGSHKTFKIGLRYYATSGWKAWKHHKVAIQEKKGSHWKTIKRVKTNKKGKAGWSRTVHKKYKYRIVVKGTPYIQGGRTSPSSKL